MNSCYAEGCYNKQYKDYFVCKYHLKHPAPISAPGIASGGSPDRKTLENRILDQAVIQGRRDGKPISKLRSYMKNGQWHYKHQD